MILVMKRTVLYLLLSLVVFFGLEKGFKWLTDGFSIDRIQSSLVFDERWETPTLGKDEQARIRSLLQQKFTYFGRGSQFFAFISEDEQHLIKFFRQRKISPSPWLTSVRFPSFLEPYRLKKIQRRNATFQDTFNSCLISFKEFSKETGVVFLHLNKTNDLKITLDIRDKIGRKFSLDLDSFEFIVQKKVESSTDYITTLMSNGESDKAKEAIASLFKLIAHRRLKGYYDKDPDLKRNFGFSNGLPIEFDIGGFVKDPNKPEGYFRNREIIKATRRFKVWLEDNYPELLPIFEEWKQFLYTLPE